jgi:glc operon protein GlcG
MSALPSKPYLRLADAKAILAAAEAHAQKNQWAVAIIVVDETGTPLASLRLDGCAPMGGQIAAEKARVAALSRRESGFYETMINQGRTAFLSAPLNGFLEGGVPVVVDGHCIGAVGVSGVKSEQDAETAKAGIAALGL